jgi:hypothetical protein
METRLPLFWWIHRTNDWMQPFTCPFLITMRILWLRLRKVDAGWWGKPSTTEGFRHEADAIERHGDVRFRIYRIPRRLVYAEIAFWNWRARRRAKVRMEATAA